MAMNSRLVHDPGEYRICPALLAVWPTTCGKISPYRVGQWRRSGERPPVAVWTTAQTARFLDSVRWHRLSAAYHLIALRGLRRGKAAGLRWCDVDLDGKTAVISQQLQQYDGRLAVCPPKTPHSTRVIALDRTTIAALAEHRDRQRAEAAAYGPGYRDSGYVFTCLNGDPMAPDRLTRTFKKLTALAGLPPIRLHDLRHGAPGRARLRRSRPVVDRACGPGALGDWVPCSRRRRHLTQPLVPMVTSGQERVVAGLLNRCGQTFSEEAGTGRPSARGCHACTAAGLT